MDKQYSLPDVHLPIHSVLASIKVLVVGDVMLDRYWFGRVDRISPEAPVPVVQVGRSEDRLGGAANVARNVVSLGAQATLVGIIGDDSVADAIRHQLDHAHIQHRLITDAEVPSTLKMRVLGGQQQLIRIDFEQSPSETSLLEVTSHVEQLIQDHDVIVFSDYAKGVLTHVDRLIEIAKSQGKRVLVDPKGHDFSKYKGADYLSPNRKEMMQIVGVWKTETELMQRAQTLREKLDIQGLLLTRSEEGMSLFAKDVTDHIPAMAHEVFDVSGAGDTVLASFAVMLALGLTSSQAMRWANLAGGIVVSKLGTSTVSYDELVNAFERMKELI